MVVDVVDQAGAARQQEHGADAARREPPDAIGQFVVDVGGGHHGLIAFRSGPILDTVEDSTLAFLEDPAVAFSGLLGDSGSHSKTSVGWNSEDVLAPQLFQILRGFSSFFQGFHLAGLQITLG